MSRSNTLFQPSPQPVTSHAAAIDEILELATKRGERLAAPFIAELDLEYKSFKSLGKESFLASFAEYIGGLRWVYGKSSDGLYKSRQHIVNKTCNFVAEALAFNGLLRRYTNEAIDKASLEKLLNQLEKIPYEIFRSFKENDMNKKGISDYQTNFLYIVNQANFLIAQALLHAKNDLVAKYTKESMAEILELRGMISRQLEQKPVADEEQSGAAVLKR